MAKAQLDINVNTVLFKYPDLYYLDLELKYEVDQDKGSAKFDKAKKSLVITLPVVGLSEAQKEEFDRHNRVKEEKEREEAILRLSEGENTLPSSDDDGGLVGNVEDLNKLS